MFRVSKMHAQPGDDDLFVIMPRNRTVAHLREYIETQWNIVPEEQKLYYQGKELVDGHKLIEYNIQRNHKIQLMIKPKIDFPSQLSSNSVFETINSQNDEVSHGDTNHAPATCRLPVESKYYKVGDPVDYRMGEAEGSNGSWFESQIVSILKDPSLAAADDDEKHLIFECSVLRYDYMSSFEAKFDEIRPRSHKVYNLDELTEGTIVLANVNMDDPKKRGYWFDVEIKTISKNEINGVFFVNSNAVPVECTSYFLKELMKIEEPILLSERGEEGLPTPELRKYPVNCTSCYDNKRRDCRKCGCNICAKKSRPDLILLCDECNMGFHINCLNPPLEKLPAEDQWFCPSCINDKDEIVKAGETLKKNSKRSKMPAAKESTSGKDWDNGMACAGRTKECTIVPKNHFGPVPGVEVGTIWKFRAQVSEAGIHRPIVAGIHGRSDEGAYSIVVSGGYEDDVDNGKEFEYTGAGGRDLSGNKRVNDQTCDQKLTQTNRALALNCKAKFNGVEGAESTDWKAGKPVRVVRKYGKSQYAPHDGYRYDGIYKIVKYYPEKGKSGFLVWKYLLRRDDPSPAPWTKSAPVFDVIYPPDYLDFEAAKKKIKAENDLKKKVAKDLKKSVEKSPKVSKTKKETTPTTNGVKRRQTSLLEFQGTAKKPKVESKYTLSSECDEWIKEDVINEHYWKECCDVLDKGKKDFLDKITEIFMCVCCQELVNSPVTLPCKHNVCKECLKRSFKAGIHSCPNCRHDLGNKYEIETNSTLYSILKTLFPGYEKGR